MVKYNSDYMNTGQISGVPSKTSHTVSPQETPSGDASSVSYIAGQQRPVSVPGQLALTDTTKDQTTIPSAELFDYNDSLTIIEIPSKDIKKSFGRKEDYVELHIYNRQKQLIYSEPNFQDYTTSEGSQLSDFIQIDPEKILLDRKYISGNYEIEIHVHRNKIFDSSYFPFLVKEISTSRKEIRSITENVDNKFFDESILSFMLELESAAYFKEFVLNFGGGKVIPGVNLILDKDPLKHELILKTSKPLPSSIQKNQTFKIVEELTDPISIQVNLGGPDVQDSSIELRGPNFQIDTRMHSSIPSKFRNYNEILKFNASSSYDHLLNKLENPDMLNISYDFVRGVSSSMEGIDVPYHFENFVHFSSAEERLRNFKYKLKLIESYDVELKNITTITSSLTSSNTFINAKEKITDQKQDLIKGFDGYEQFLYYTTGSNSYTWPKSNATSPFELYSISSSQAIDWLGDGSGSIPDYKGQLLSASLYDRQNENNLIKLIPQHILDNPNNDIYIKFVSMIGQHFDLVWNHIKHISEINNLDHKFGISKELVYYQLKSLGIDAFDQFENSNLVEYILGEGLQDHTIGNLVIGDYIVGGLSNHFYNAPFGTTTYVTASNDGSIPKGDITREIWKRLYNNAPYLLKTKGTERGLRALMNCYGVPSTILHVKEYGGNTLASGPLKDLDISDTYKTFSYDKSSISLKGHTATGAGSRNGGFFIKTPWSSSRTDAMSSSAKTIEVRVKPEREVAETSQIVFHLSSSNGFIYNLDLFVEPYTSTDVSSSGDASQYGRLKLVLGQGINKSATTEYFPVYNGDYWNMFVGTSGSEGANSDLIFGAYQSNWLKHVTAVTNSFSITPLDRQASLGDPWYGSKNHGGGHSLFFGGNPNQSSTSYDFSGSMQEIRVYFGELLSHSTLKKHALDPFMYGGNTPSSSYEHLVLRLPLGSNDKQDSSSFHPNIDVNYLEYAGIGQGCPWVSTVGEAFDAPEIESGNYCGWHHAGGYIPGSPIENGFIIEDYKVMGVVSQIPVNTTNGTGSQSWEEITETHHLPTPDTVGASMTSEKVRIDDGTIASDNILSVDKRSETSTLDRQPPDYEDLGIHFSPTFEMNEDILYSLGPFRLDDYIGNPLPSAQTASVYEDLKNIREHYTKKLRDKYDYWDYIKIIQQFDHTLFKLVEQFVPFKANTKTGLLIEPTYLERNKFAREVPIRSDAQTMTTGSHQTLWAQIGTYYSGSILYSFATSSQQTRRGFGYDKFPMSRGGYSASVGRWEPGSYVVSDNNLLFTTSSKTSERLERGTNGTIEIYGDYLDPTRHQKNAFGAFHENNGQDCQAPIKPFVKRVSGIGGNNYGIGAAAIEVSFVIEDWYANGGGNLAGVGFSAIEDGFMVEGYLSSGFTGIGNAVIGSTFVVGTYTVLPQLSTDPNQYRTHKSSVLLGNMMTGRKSNKYFKYNTYTQPT